MSAVSAVVLLVLAGVNSGWESMEGRVISGHPESRLQAVAKPVVPEPDAAAAEPQQQTEPHQETGPKQQTVFQNPQEFDLRGLQQGFGQGATTQPAPRSQGPLREFANNLGEATRQSLNDLGDGARGIYDGAAEGLNSTVDALGDVGRNTVNAGNPDYFAGRRAASEARSVPPPDWTGNQNPAPPITQQPRQLEPTQFEADLFDNSLPSSQTAQANNSGTSQTGGQIATSFADEDEQNRYPGQGFAGQGAPAQNAPNQNAAGQGYPGNAFGGDPGYRRSQLSPVNQNQYPSNQQSGAGYPAYNSNQNFGPTVAQQPNATQQPWPNPSQRGPAPLLAPPLNAPAQTAANSYPQNTSSASNWPAPSQQQSSPPYQQPQQQPITQTAGVGGAGQTWTNLQEIGTAPAGNQTPATPASQQEARANAPSSPDAWLFAFLIASWAITIYVGMTYLDIRNKYRAVLRRNPGTYNIAA